MELAESIIDPVKTMNRAWEMVRSANDEILILFSSATHSLVRIMKGL